VGFGIDGPEKAQAVSKYADIIVIGSEVIKIVDRNRDNYQEKIYEFLKQITDVINK